MATTTKPMDYDETVEDIEEHAVGHLPPFMVPRSLERLPGE